MSSLGSRIRALRDEMHLTQADLAMQIRVARPTLANWEMNRRAPDHEDLVRLAKALSVTVDYLLGAPEQKAPTQDPLDWPAGVAFLRRASTELTPEMKQKVIKAMEQFLEDDNADTPE